MKTIIYYTANCEDDKLEEEVIKSIKLGAGDIPIISVSQKPMDFGKNICVGDVGQTYLNAFRQLLIGCKEATTEYVVMAEADTLYPPKGYFDYEPSDPNKIYSYDNVWILYNNKFHNKGQTHASLIYGREWLIGFLEKCLEGLPEWSRERVDFPFFTPEQEFEHFTGDPIISVKTGRGVNKKRMPDFRPVDSLPYWGTVEEVNKKINRKYDLSIVIPARNEMFLKNTVEDILKNKQGKTEVIIGLDGEWANPPIVDHPDVTIIHSGVSLGQRAITNQCVRLSKAKYIMKLDAHCALDKGFDVKLMNRIQDDWTVVPIMKNLHAFDWVCPDGHSRYQGKSGVCEVCGKETKREMKWIGKQNPQSTSYSFDSEPHFQYFREYTKRDEYREGLKEGLTETMSLQGSCFMLTRDKYWELNICDEEVGNWGNQGIEVACKTWLSGGKCMVVHDTWYAHMFRTQGGDFGFPYALGGREVDKTKKKVWNFFLDGKWDKQIHSVGWLIEKFAPIPGWTEEAIKELNKG